MHKCTVYPVYFTYPKNDSCVVKTIDQKCHVEMDKEKGIDSKPYQLKYKR